MPKLGVLMGHRHCLKHLSVPGKTKLKKDFLKIPKTHGPPGNLASVMGRGRGRRKETSPFCWPVGAEPSRRRLARDHQTEARALAGSPLEGKARVLAAEQFSVTNPCQPALPWLK